MDPQLESITAYIGQQLRAGMIPDDIVAQLRAAGWPDNLIQQAFQVVHVQMLPTGFAAVQTASELPVPTPKSTPIRRGRIKTGWQLFKQSLTLLRGNKYLLRYLIMTGLWVFGITGALIAIYIHLILTYHYTTAARYILTVVDYVAIYFFINLYAAGLTVNVLDIFQGQRKPYREYMRMAWRKAPALFVFSLISATIGIFLRHVVERIRWVGWLAAWIFGVMWSLGTSFVIPIIMTSEKPSGVTSIKTSIRFFKQTWGENITAKASVNAPLFLINIIVVTITFFAFIPAAQALNLIGVCIVLGLYLVAALTLAILGSFATSLVNIALFYFATYHTVPPAFGEDLLNSVFIQSKLRRSKKNKTVQ